MTRDGKSESIEVVFKNPVHELNVAFAWRATQESAKVDFYDENGNKVGHAIIFGGDGSVVMMTSICALALSHPFTVCDTK